MLPKLHECYLNVNFIHQYVSKALKPLFIILLCLGSLACQSQAELGEFLKTSEQEDISPSALHQLEKLISTMEVKGQSEKQKLHKVFQKLHRSYLKKYVPYASFSEMFTNGSFDCLTGTALFSYVLDRMGYQYDIIETNYHIFIMVRTSAEEILLETTDRFGGFVSDPDQIAERTGDYRQNILASSKPGSLQYKYSFQLYQVINVKQVTGLLYFNQAVKAFNDHDWVNSTKMLGKAMNYYPSARCQELSSLLERTLMSAQIDEKSREICFGLLQNYSSPNSMVRAAR